MAQSYAAHADPAVPRAVSRAAMCFAVVSIAALLFLIWQGLTTGISLRRSGGTFLGLLASLSLWLNLPTARPGSRIGALAFGMIVVVYSAGALIYGALQMATWGIPRAAAVVLADALLVAPTVTLVAGAAAVILLLRPESSEFFRRANTERTRSSAKPVGAGD